MDQLLEAVLYGDVTRSYYDLWAGYENARVRRCSDLGEQFQGPSRPMPTLVAYPGYDGPMASNTYYWDNGVWRNCQNEQEVWNGESKSRPEGRLYRCGTGCRTRNFG